MAAMPMLSQNPDAIYIGTWDGMTAAYGQNGVGTPVTPNTNDPKLTYNETTQCYEGEIFDWAKSGGTTSWNAKIPYSFDGETVTYYSGTSYSNLNFSSDPSSASPISLKFEISQDPSNLKGYNIASFSQGSVFAAKVSLDIETFTITFTQIANESQAPQLLSTVPENGQMLFPDADGNAEIILNFSGEVTSMRVLIEGSEITAKPDADGTSWTIPLTSRQVENALNESAGTLNLVIDQVMAGNLPVDFEGNSLMLFLSFPVDGLTHFVYFEFEGKTDVLSVYRSPFYTLGQEIDIEDDELTSMYLDRATYLFTAPEGYEISISSSLESEDGENYTSGKAWSVKEIIDPVTETSSEENYLEGPTLTVFSGADNALFTISVSEVGAGVSSLISDSKNEAVYNLQGVKVNPENLTPGIYILNGKKTLIK